MTITSTLPTAESAPRDDRGGPPQQVEARRTLPLRVGIGKMTADVAGRRGAEDGVGHRMADDVGVRVAEQPALERNRHAAEDQRTALHQPMQIVAGAGAAG